MVAGSITTKSVLLYPFVFVVFVFYFEQCFAVNQFAMSLVHNAAIIFTPI